MSAGNVGRRYERLLFFAGPLAVACVLVLFIAVASDQQDERRRAKCLRAAVTAINGYDAELNTAWAGKPVRIQNDVTSDYMLALRLALIPVEVRDRCEDYFDLADKVSVQQWRKRPADLVKWLDERVKTLQSKPISLYGVEVPEKATLNVFGTPVKMELQTLVRVLQLALLPILLLWLGSLFHTRHRESLFNARASDVRHLYPHLINVYPVNYHERGFALPALKRKSWTLYAVIVHGVPFMFALARISLLCVFLGPPVVLYLASLFFAETGEYAGFFFATGMIVLMFALSNVIAELMPWQWKKRFTVSI